METIKANLENAPPYSYSPQPMQSDPTLSAGIILSDSVIREEGTKKYTMVGIFQQFLAGGFPFTTPPFFATAFITNLSGKLESAKVCARVEEKSSGQVLSSCSAEANSSNELTREETFIIPFPIPSMRVDVAGLYRVVILFNNETVGSILIPVKVTTSA